MQYSVHGGGLGRSLGLLRFSLQHSEDEYSAVVLTDVQQSVQVVETEARRTVERVVGVQQLVSGLLEPVHPQHLQSATSIY